MIVSSNRSGDKSTKTIAVIPHSSCTRHQVPSAPASPGWRRFDGLVGVGYLLLTLSCMTYFVSVLTPSLTNDLYWPTYNRTGFAIFMIDVINIQLQTASMSATSLTPTPIDLLSVMMPKSYESDVVQATFDSSTGRRILLSEMNDIERAVRDIRTTTPPGVAQLYAHYCWVDLDRRWDIAHTTARASRCSEKYRHDAAKYLEATLRNTNWTNFEFTYRDMWGVSIGWAVAKPVDGQQWLSDRPRHALALSVSDEVAFLQSYNLSKFTLQWHNDYRTSLTETIDVENALGQRQAVILKAIPFGRASWSTVTMYWAFRNDMGAMAFFNTSLVRGDARHFETVLNLPFSAMYGLTDENWQYQDQTALFFYNIGPFGSVDLNLVPRPPALLALYTEFRRLLLDQMWSKPDLSAAFVAIPNIVLTPLPPRFTQQEWIFYGGNLLCLYNRPTPFPQSQLAFDDQCSQSQQLAMAASREAMLFAMLASRGPVNASTCAMQYGSSGQGTQDCVSVLRAIAAVGQAMSVEAGSNFNQLVASAIGALPPLQLFQYAKRIGSTPQNGWALLHQPLLDPTDVSWSFYGWLVLFDWTQGTREAIVFDGDATTVFAISEVNPVTVLPSTSQSQGDQSGPQTIYVLVVYMTSLSVALGAVVLVYVLRLQWKGGRFEGRNLLAFNRVTALVWVGRPLLLLRGLTAILMLSSTTTSLVQELGYSKLVATARSPWNTLVVAGEATWVTYVVTDVLLVASGDAGAVMAPLSSALSFGAIVLLDFLQPISLVATLNRRCTAIDIGKGLDCSSGVVRTGDNNRIILLLGVQGVAMVIGGAVAIAWRQRKPRPSGGDRKTAPLVLHGAAATFLHHDGPHDHDAWQLDDVACVMTGLLPFAWRGQHHSFDVKLWVLVPDSDKGRRQLNQLMSFHKPSFKLPRTNAPPTDEACVKGAVVRGGLWWHRVAILSGFLYILLSGFGSVSYIAVSTVNFANDFYWASFNLTGHHAVIANWFNLQLPLRRDRSVVAVRLDQRCWAAFASNFSSPRNSAAYAALYGTTLQAGTAEATKLDVVIAGLRRSRPCEIPWISTQYCWVDFDRRWPLASSTRRQQRCLSEVANGAVYLEAVLRNVKWSAWAECWGTSLNLGIRNELETSLEGRAWLEMVSTSPWTSASDEVDHWARAGIDKYVVQWQNYKSLGLINTYTIETALGVQYPMTLSRVNGSYTRASQATFKMYWAFASDLWAVGDNSTLMGGKSLVATSANYAFQNQSTMFSALVQNGTLLAPLPEAFFVFQRDIGPYGSVDMKILPCPRSVQALLATGYGILRETLASASLNASLAYLTVSIESPLVVPSKFKRIPRGLSFGGNILCPDFNNVEITKRMRELTKRDGSCDRLVASGLSPSRDLMLLATLAARLGGANTSTIDRICWHDSSPNNCPARFLQPAVKWIQHIAQDDVDTINALVAPALTHVRAMNVSLVQYLRPTYRELHIGQSMVLDPDDPTFEYWGWFYALEWGMAHREVVRFEGDRGAIHVMSEWRGFTAQSIASQEMPTTFATYARSGVQYVTGVMLGVTCVYGMYIVTSRGRVELSNVLKLNRVAGIVWVGRPLLLLRGLTALCLLSTSTLELQRFGESTAMAGFHVPSLPWYKTILGAGETTWLVYILNDLLMVWTKHATASYASKSSVLVWLVSAVVTLVWPVVHSATIAPTCDIDQIDFQLVCNSGIIKIGDVHRLYGLLGIIGICNLLCYVVTRLTQKHDAADASSSSSLLLSAGAKYLFNRTHWTIANVYCIDSASALLNGLLTFRTQRRTFVLDIKLWRWFAIDHNNVPPHFKFAVPLTD